MRMGKKESAHRLRRWAPVRVGMSRVLLRNEVKGFGLATLAVGAGLRHGGGFVPADGVGEGVSDRGLIADDIAEAFEVGDDSLHGFAVFVPFGAGEEVTGVFKSFVFLDEGFAVECETGFCHHGDDVIGVGQLG